MSYWEGPTRWVNTLLLIIVGFIGFDALFRMLEANEANVIVGFVNDVATYFLQPFVGMFAEEDSMLTALVAVLGYSLAAGILLAILRAIQASRPSNIRRTRYREEDRDRYREGRDFEDDRTRSIGSDSPGYHQPKRTWRRDRSEAEPTRALGPVPPREPPQDREAEPRGESQRERREPDWSRDAEQQEDRTQQL